MERNSRSGGAVVQLCPSCGSHWGDSARSRKPVTPRPRRCGARNQDTYDDLYWEGAPTDSIGSGADYGRLKCFEEHGVEMPSMLEAMVLAEVRAPFPSSSRSRIFAFSLSLALSLSLSLSLSLTRPLGPSLPRFRLCASVSPVVPNALGGREGGGERQGDRVAAVDWPQ